MNESIELSKFKTLVSKLFLGVIPPWRDLGLVLDDDDEEAIVFLDLFCAIDFKMHKRNADLLSREEKMFLKLFEHEITNAIENCLHIDFSMHELWALI